MSGLDFFYDSQIRSYLKQIIAVFHGYQYQYYLSDGTTALRQIPVRWGDPNRMAMHIVNNNSENTIRSAPFMTVWISQMGYEPSRTQLPNHIEKLQVFEREYDEEAQAYTTGPGKKYTVQRFMPVPYNMTVQLDVWTTNIEQKLQIFEQISLLFNPTLDIQSNTNALDWTALTYMRIEDVTFSSRSIPVGTDSAMDIMTISFLVPIWINPPAKVQKQSVIHEIIQNFVDLESDCLGKDAAYISGGDLYDRIITTPHDHQIEVSGNEVTLLSSEGNETDENGALLDWETLLIEYGNFKPQITQLRLKHYCANIDTEEGDVVGTIELHPTESNKLLWTIDITTLPGNTLDPIDAIINPHTVYPGGGLPAAASGQRYLVTEKIGGVDQPANPGDTLAWGSLVAYENDIIQYNGTTWSVVFDASATLDRQFAVNSYSGKQLTWDGTEWILAIDGTYMPGIWRLYF